MPYLLLICGKTNGLRLELNQTEVTIGRLDSNTIVVNDLAVSGRHCSLSREGVGYRIRDSGSTNSVGLNGQTVRDSELHHGDILSIGSSEFIYCTEEGGFDEVPPVKSSPSFNPVPPKVSFLGRMFWPFTCEGRARRSLQLAFAFPDEPKRSEDVAAALFKLTAGKGSLSPAAKALHSDLLVFLAWKPLTRGESGKSEDYLALLDGSFPSLEAKTSLRLDLMRLLWVEGKKDAYVRQAGLFVADGQAADPARSTAILDIIKTIYERVSPVVCANVIDKASSSIKGRVQLVAARALCACPPVFDRPAEAKKWTAQINPVVLSFSKQMAADAFLVVARADETVPDLTGMLNSTLQALRLAPAHPEVLYWLTRAKLHVPDSNPVNHLGAVAFSNDPTWERLAILVPIHQKPGVATAVAALPMLEGKLGKLALPEVSLLAELVRRALGNVPGFTPEEVEAADQLCRALQTRVGVAPWTQVPVAHKKIRLDREFKAAYKLLEQDGIIDEHSAGQFARIARILDGSPLKPKGSLTLDALNVMELVAYRLLEAPAVKASSGDAHLLKGLQACRQNAVFDQFPDLKEVADVLTLALRVVGGETSRVWLELQSYKLSTNASPWLVWLHARIGRLAKESRAEPGENGNRSQSFIKANLGDLAGSTYEAELDLEVRFASARQALSKKKPAEAVSVLQALDEGLSEVCILTAMRWCPLVRYWLGVAYAHQHGDSRAASILTGLLDGALGNEARGQLALLALRDGFISEAAKWLDDASDLVPSVRYAKALVLARTEKPLEARQWLISDDAERVFFGSAYAVPAQRLVAVIEERCGNRDESDQLNSAILETHPDDEVAGIRLVRSLLERAYAQFLANRALDPETLGNRLQQLIPVITTTLPWWQSYVFLHDVLSASADSFGEHANRVGLLFVEVERSLAWRQILAARYLGTKNPGAALQVLDIPVSRGDAQWFERARLLLRTWHGLTRLSDEMSRASAVRELDECVRGLEPFAKDDVTVSQWRTLAELGASLGAENSRTPHDCLRGFSGGPMANISRLFGDDQKQRLVAAETILATLSSDGAGWCEEQRLLLHAVAAWAAEKDDLFIEQVSYLEPVLGELPVTGRDLWVPAALVRFAKGDWQSLTGDCLPDCLADMSDPLVCLIVELADARATVGDLKKPNQQTAKTIKGIYNNLAALLERLDEPGDDANAKL